MHGPGCQTVQAEGDGCRYKENDYAAIILRMMHGDNVEDDGNYVENYGNYVEYDVDDVEDDGDYVEDDGNV